MLNGVSYRTTEKPKGRARADQTFVNNGFTGISCSKMADNSGDQSGENSSFAHKFSPEPLWLQQLHAAPNHGDQTTNSSSARQSTDIIENELDVLKVREKD